MIYIDIKNIKLMYIYVTGYKAKAIKFGPKAKVKALTSLEPTPVALTLCRVVFFTEADNRCHNSAGIEISDTCKKKN
jgi:hypothetical protein